MERGREERKNQWLKLVENIEQEVGLVLYTLFPSRLWKCRGSPAEWIGWQSAPAEQDSGHCQNLRRGSERDLWGNWKRFIWKRREGKSALREITIRDESSAFLTQESGGSFWSCSKIASSTTCSKYCNENFPPFLLCHMLMAELTSSE